MRDHQVFQKPRPLDLTATLTTPPPADWAPYLQGAERQQISFLPLVAATKAEAGSWGAGWCTYVEHLGDSPDLEVLCGGMNSKLPSAAAVWRQGNLLHFGFQQDPSQLNDNGRALLHNCIVYIARFRSDRPLVRTPSPFVDGEYPKPLRYLLRAVQLENSTPEGLARQFAEPWQQHLAGKSLAEIREWVAQNVGWLCSGAGGRLTIDEAARDLGLRLAQPDFVAAAVTALGEPATREPARALLARRVPDGPGAAASEAEWRAFATANGPYLFFLEEGGHQWHLDPLAKARAVPCAELRGPDRADPSHRSTSR